MPEVFGPFTVNREDVAAKVIDGELIIIRLSDGTYYSMENVGTHVWDLIERGNDVATVIHTISAWYGTPVERVQGDVDALVAQLLAEGLITPAQANGDEPGPEPPAAAPLTYQPPQLHIYRDMGNLLALDPPTPGIDDMMLPDADAR